MAEENARNLREAKTTQLENERLSDQSGHDIVKRGQHYGLITVLSFVILAALALLLGHPAIALTICSVTIAAVATVFVTGRAPKKDGDQ